ncbi:MAG: FmdE family protein [bacterium]
MTGEEIVGTAAFKRCLEFHGHLCPGLCIGFRAARAGLDWLEENRARDEELVAIVENDACGCDAVQVLTGCTFGKGNLLFRDHGKQVFTFVARKSGKAVRVALKPDRTPRSERHAELVRKRQKGELTAEEAQELAELHRKRSHAILERPAEELFTVRPVAIPTPPQARIHASVPCDRCAEPTMETRLEAVGGRRLCRECAAAAGR